MTERERFEAWYKHADWGNEDFVEGCYRAWQAALKGEIE